MYVGREEGKMKLIKNLLGPSILMILIVVLNMVSMIPTARAPATYIYVNPAEVINIAPGGILPKIKVNVTNAPSTYAWEIRLDWDSALLNLSQVKEGNFLSGTGSTSFMYTPLDEANLNGEVIVSCALLGTTPSPGGADKYLCYFGFKVKALAYGSTLLNLFETRLADHLVGGYPAYTYYPNYDGFFYNVALPSHDIRITHITVLNASVHLDEVARINVTVLNEGTVTETFNIYVYADIDPTVIGDEITIFTASHSLNGAGNSEDRSFTFGVTWNTAGCSKVSYTISAYVQPVSGEGDTADNTRIDGTVLIKKMLGDVNGDDKVDINDLILWRKAYGSKLLDSNYNGDCDFNVDGKVDIYDLFPLGKAYGRSG